MVQSSRTANSASAVLISLSIFMFPSICPASSLVSRSSYSNNIRTYRDFSRRSSLSSFAHLYNAANGMDHDHFEYPPAQKNATIISTLEPRRSRMTKKKVGNYATAEAGTLGDIMSWVTEEEPATDSPKDILASNLPISQQRAGSGSSGLVTTATPSGSLANQFGIQHPLDRMALTANGNLQRLVSSYYDAPVHVLVDRCDQVEQEDLESASSLSSPSVNGRSTTPARIWNRIVHLTVHNQTFCTAHSIITVYDPMCQQLVESGHVGLGQLFRYLDILPEFELHDAGLYDTPEQEKLDGGGFWRDYSLSCAELTCRIREDLKPGMWNIVPLD